MFNINYLKLFDLKVFHYLYYKFYFLFYLKINRIIKNFRKTYVKLGHNSQLIPIPKKFFNQSDLEPVFIGISQHNLHKIFLTVINWDWYFDTSKYIK